MRYLIEVQTREDNLSVETDDIEITAEEITKQYADNLANSKAMWLVIGKNHTIAFPTERVLWIEITALKDKSDS